MTRIEKVDKLIKHYNDLEGDSISVYIKSLALMTDNQLANHYYIMFEHKEESIFPNENKTIIK